MLTDAMPSGRARFGELEYDVAVTSGFLSRGQTVRVVALEGSEILVQPERTNHEP
jgi:membrane-bound ClpP family serine protease